MKKRLAIALGLVLLTTTAQAQPSNILGNDKDYCSAVGVIGEGFASMHRLGFTQEDAGAHFRSALTAQEWTALAPYIGMAVDIIWKKTTPNSPKEVGDFMQSLCLLHKKEAKKHGQKPTPQ